MKRQILIPGLAARTAQGSTTADQFFGLLEGGYRIALDDGPANAALTPFARLQGSTTTQAAFSETGADSLDLGVAQQTTNSLRTVLGGQLSGDIAKVNLRLQLGWSHEFADPSRPVTASFAGAPAITFTTLGAATPRDGATVGLMATARLAESISFYARYDGELQGGTTSNVFFAGLRIVW
jgi:outer membrane autotransporter protein